MMMKLKAWINACRLRTLSLAFSSMVLAAFLAAHEGLFSLKTFLLMSTTGLLLQVLSNLANDFGDFMSGVDNGYRLGPERSMQGGKINKKQMIRMIVLLAVLAFFFGTFLLIEASNRLQKLHIALMFVLGLLAIAAALYYTMGKNPYGYRGLGDISVFLFFGPIGVAGGYFLYTGFMDCRVLLPATSVGLLSVGVLNLNNMRDIENDKRNGKRTLAVMLGLRKARIYHMLLILSSILLACLHSFLHWHSWLQLLFLVSVPFLAGHLKMVLSNRQPGLLDAGLKPLALLNFLFSISFGLGLVLCACLW